MHAQFSKLKYAVAQVGYMKERAKVNMSDFHPSIAPFSTSEGRPQVPQ